MINNSQDLWINIQIFLSSRGLIQFQNTFQLTKEIWMTIWLLLALSLSQLTVIKVEILDQINYNLEIMKNWISTHQKGLSLTLCNRCLKILFPIPTRNKRSWHPKSRPKVQASQV